MLRKKLFYLVIALTMLVALIPSVAVAAPEGQGETVYTVQKDDNLWAIAEKYLGTGAAYGAIVVATSAKHETDPSFARIDNPSLIQPGWKILVPSAEEAAKLVEEWGAAKKVGGRLIFGLSWEPAGIDPHVSGSAECRIISKLVFEGLVRQTPDGTFPSLATDWEISDDGMTYTFHLRDDVTFHDGTPFNAEAVKYSLDRIVDPATKSESAASLIGPYESTEIVDDYTVRIHLSEPYAPFLTFLAHPIIAMVSPAAAEKWGEDFDDHMVGTGPFIFKEWVRQDHMTVVRNPDYNWGPASFDHQGPAYLDEIVFKFIPEATVRVGTLETGEVDMINEVPPLDFERLAADPAYNMYTVIRLGAPFAIGMNVTRPPLDDLRVRQALEYAIDRQGIVDTLFPGVSPAVSGPLTPNLLGYWAGAEEMYGYDPAKAKSLLEEAGWVDTDGDGIRDKDGQPLQLWWPAFRFERTNEVAEMVQAQLKEVGINLKVDVLTFAAINEAWNKCEHNLVHFGFLGPDPDVLSVLFLSSNVGSGWAATCIKDDQIDDLLTRGRATTDKDERIAIYTEVQQIIMDKALIVPIRAYTLLIATRAELKGMQFDPVGYVPLFYEVYMEK
jgi:peptide/nickel transport system substrate-binding protein